MLASSSNEKGGKSSHGATRTKFSHVPVPPLQYCFYYLMIWRFVPPQWNDLIILALHFIFSSPLSLWMLMKINKWIQQQKMGPPFQRSPADRSSSPTRNDWMNTFKMKMAFFRLHNVGTQNNRMNLENNNPAGQSLASRTISCTKENIYQPNPLADL